MRLSEYGKLLEVLYELGVDCEHTNPDHYSEAPQIRITAGNVAIKFVFDEVAEFVRLEEVCE